jgi:outer membrane biogenesis lipoprotein LolB
MRRSPRLPRLLILPLLAVVAAALLGGCAPARPGAPSADEAKAVYQTFLDNQAKNEPAKAFSLSGSLSFARAGKSGRLNYRLYGNYAAPVRLDLTTPMGGAYAHLREAGGEFTAFVPGRDMVYTHADTRAGAAKLGMPLPFTLRELAAIVSGRLGELAASRYASAKKVEGGYEYAFSSDPRLASLTLDFQGKPRHLTGRGVEPWRIAFEDDEAAPGFAAPVARRLTLTTPGGATLTLRVKTLQPRPAPFPAADLELPVPPTVAVRPLDAAGDEGLLPEL